MIRGAGSPVSGFRVGAGCRVCSSCAAGGQGRAARAGLRAWGAGPGPGGRGRAARAGLRAGGQGAGPGPARAGGPGLAAAG